MALHVRRDVRDRYGLTGALLSPEGQLVLGDVEWARVFAHRVNEARKGGGGLASTRSPSRVMVADEQGVVHAGQVHAMSLIDDILRGVVDFYTDRVDPHATLHALDKLDDEVGPDDVERTLRAFAEQFGTARLEPEEEIGDREPLLLGLLALWLSNENHAFADMRELFDDRELRDRSAYLRVIAGLKRSFEARAPFGPDGQDLVTLLRSPAIAHPESVSEQLRYIHERWGDLVTGHLDRLVAGLDLLLEEERAVALRFRGDVGGAADGRVPVYDFTGLEAEPEHFSEDRDWMPRLVLIAKSTYVWLDQLSRTYAREIRALDAIPDEELDTLARRGITGLWLIGLWERSRASLRIKQLRGNPDAAASAYSVMDYRIADDLGGERAYEDLRERASRRGIRLAADMVPNHMGIDSRWLVEHPDRFLSLDRSPFPAYSFDGPDLSDDDRVSVILEDHYWDTSDAAVVFKRVDTATGGERYVYHGNDGTSMPWNDTAQLDYLHGETREAVIRTILDVARRFPVIRFDAAMTLAKRHVQRLWYPEPGSAGAIPSRAEHAMSGAEFDRAMPHEFWREVVDRVAAEVPDTLLLAEAFWLMEGYFVRTLGMHRVYNSAFMHMLRDEDNAGYRRVMRNTLEFDPEVLKRYVSFMSNPDERTAIDQFGTGDKYFGVCTLLATLPGLPMLGHGQIEGFREKYGHEFRRARRDERPDPALVAEHERRIFPLLHRRRLFAEVRDFLLYDAVDADGNVLEDVFAYSNRDGDDRVLVVYHNRFATARGRIRDSVPFSERAADGGRRLRRRSVADGLGLSAEPGAMSTARDFVSGLEYVYGNESIVSRGLPVELDAYRCLVLSEWHEVQESERAAHGRLGERLEGRGVPSIAAALEELRLEPLHAALRRVVNAGFFRWVADTVADAGHRRGGEEMQAFTDDVRRQTREMLEALGEATSGHDDGVTGERDDAATGERDDAATAADDLVARLLAVARLLDDEQGDEVGRPASAVSRRVRSLLAAGDQEAWGVLLGWLVAEAISEVISAKRHGRDRTPLEALRLEHVLADVLRGLALEDDRVAHAVETIRILVALPGISAVEAPADQAPSRLVYAWFQDEEVSEFLGVNRYEGIAWFNKERYEQLLDWFVVVARTRVRSESDGEARTPAALRADALVQALADAGVESAYQVGRLIELARLGLPKLTAEGAAAEGAAEGRAGE